VTRNKVIFSTNTISSAPIGGLIVGALRIRSRGLPNGIVGVLRNGMDFLAIAIVSEVIATTALRASDGFSRLGHPASLSLVIRFPSFYSAVDSCWDRLCCLVRNRYRLDLHCRLADLWPKA